jgi:hypothetical protein
MLLSRRHLSYTYRCKHIPVDTVIYMYMLFQWPACDCVVPFNPELFPRHPLATCRFDLCPQEHVRSRDAERDKGIRSKSRQRWCPVGLLLNQFYGFQLFPGLLVIAESDTPQAVPIFFHQTFGPFLSRFQLDQSLWGQESMRSYKIATLPWC